MTLNSTPEVLIVESFGSNTRSISSHLKALPFPLEILCAGDAEIAVNLIQKVRVDLAIIDTSLRGKMDGFDLCHALRSSPATERLPIILLLSGYLSLERAKGILAGADLLLHRPVVKEELMRMLELLLGEKLEPAATQDSTAPRLRSVS